MCDERVQQRPNLEGLISVLARVLYHHTSHQNKSKSLWLWSVGVVTKRARRILKIPSKITTGSYLEVCVAPKFDL
jgi:hypothetical protein